MNITRNKTLLLSLAVFAAVVVWEFNLLSSRDEWICQNGKWTANGNPADPMPIFDCKTVKDKNIVYDVYCEKDSDCACGGYVRKSQCFIGNKRYLDPLSKCDKLCSNNFKIKCVKNQCRQAK